MSRVRERSIETTPLTSFIVTRDQLRLDVVRDPRSKTPAMSVLSASSMILSLADVARPRCSIFEHVANLDSKLLYPFVTFSRSRVCFKLITLEVHDSTVLVFPHECLSGRVRNPDPTI